MISFYVHDCAAFLLLLCTCTTMMMILFRRSFFFGVGRGATPRLVTHVQLCYQLLDEKLCFLFDPFGLWFVPLMRRLDVCMLP